MRRAGGRGTWTLGRLFAAGVLLAVGCAHDPGTAGGSGGPISSATSNSWPTETSGATGTAAPSGSPVAAGAPAALLTGPALAAAKAALDAACTPAVPAFSAATGAAALPLLGGRLRVRMPAAARLEARAASLMAAEEANEDETRVVLDAGPERLVFMTYELYALSGPSFEAAARADTETGFPGQTPRLSPSGGCGGVPRAMLVEPGSLATTDEAVFVLGAYLANPDGSVQYAAVYVNPEAAKSPEGCGRLATALGAPRGGDVAVPGDHRACRSVARRVIASLSVGDRPLTLPRGSLQLEVGRGARLVLATPGDLAVSTQRGPDFLVHRLRRLGVLGQPAASLGVYVGDHPSFHHRQQDAAGSIEKKTGTVLGKPAEWQQWSEAPGAAVVETIVELPGDDRLRLHLFASGAPGPELDSLRQLAAGLRVERVEPAGAR